MRTTRVSATVAATISTLATALLIAGCSATSAPPDPKNTDPASAADPATDPARDPSNKTSNRTLNADDSPLRKYMGWSYSADARRLSEELSAEDQKAADEAWAETNKLLASCMKEQGFDYFPPSNEVPLDLSAEILYDPLKDDVEYIKQNGYGVAIMADPVPEPPQGDDVAYFESLSPSEQEAYGRAMEGEYSGLSTDDPLAQEPWDWRKGGCHGSVSNKRHPEAADAAQKTYPTEEYQPLLEQAWALEQEAKKTPEQKALNEKWSDCMAESGHSYEDDYDAYVKLSDEFFAMGRSDPEESNNQLYDTASDEFKAFREKELDAALDSYECREKLHFADESLKIQFAMEEKFLENHRAELDAYKAAEELERLDSEKASAERKAKRDKEKTDAPKP